MSPGPSGSGLYCVGVRPGSVVVVRDDRLVEQPNLSVRRFRTEAATAIRKAKLDTEESHIIWALVLSADSWEQLAGWVRLRLGRGRPPAR